MDEKIPQLTLTPDLNSVPTPEIPQPSGIAAQAPAPEAGPDMTS